ncbi:hypothetical protein [Vibrio phage phiKT1028]|nr:hypothetical protein [Vibrio phage phiKT1028]
MSIHGQNIQEVPAVETNPSVDPIVYQTNTEGNNIMEEELSKILGEVEEEQSTPVESVEEDDKKVISKTLYVSPERMLAGIAGTMCGAVATNSNTAVITGTLASMAVSVSTEPSDEEKSLTKEIGIGLVTGLAGSTIGGLLANMLSSSKAEA